MTRTFSRTVTSTLLGVIVLAPVSAGVMAKTIVAPPVPPAVAAAQPVSSAVPSAQANEVIEVPASTFATPKAATMPSPLNFPAPVDSSLNKPKTLPPVPITAPGAPSSQPALGDAFAGMVLTPVSDSQLNRFVFPESIEGIYFSEGAPLPSCGEHAGVQDPCKPVFLNNKRMMLLQLRAGARGPVQMLAHLESGRVVTLNLAPEPGPGAVVRIEGAEDGASDTRLAKAYRESKLTNANLTPAEQNVELLSQIAQGEIPAGFEAENIGVTVRFEHFDVIPMAAWGNGSDLKAHLFQIKGHSGAPVSIDSSLFRTPNVKALALDRDTITHDAPAMLYMLEQVKGAY